MKKIGVGRSVFIVASLTLVVGLVGGLIWSQQSASAVTPPPGPKSGSVGVEGTIPSPPPTQAATIVSPANGQSFSSIPVTVTGSCPKDTLVKIFSNNIFVGSVLCANGSYTLQVALFSGRNDLIARVFDALDQQGPDSNVVTVTYNDAQFGQFGSHVIITSQYARRAAGPGIEVEWPVIVSGGIGPYALSVDWGDGTPAELHSEPFADTFTYKHIFKSSGIYRVTFKVVDSNGGAGYLQVVAVTTGTLATNTANGTNKQDTKTTVTKTKILWIPTVALIFLAMVTFWLGRRFELATLRKRIEREYQ